MTGQDKYGVLRALSEAPEHTLWMGEPAKVANASLSKLSRAIGRLERHRILTAVRVESDRLPGS